MTSMRGGGEAPSARTGPGPLKAGEYNKDGIADTQFSAALALGGCAGTTLVKSRFPSSEDLLMHLEGNT